MWPPWNKPTLQIHTTSPFSCSSFKDIQTLLQEETQPGQPTKLSIFRRVKLANSLLKTWSTHLQQNHHQPEPDSDNPPASLPDPPPLSIPGAEQRVVVYFTSLRVVRATFEDCKTVRSILSGFKVAVDERDVSMDSGFLSELHRLVGRKTGLTLPRVFIGGKYIGGAEEVRWLNESGELKKLLEWLPAADYSSRECHVCGDHRFILCEECSGAHKVYTEKGGFKSCTACNESGLIRCFSCTC